MDIDSTKGAPINVYGGDNRRHACFGGVLVFGSVELGRKQLSYQQRGCQQRVSERLFGK